MNPASVGKIYMIKCLVSSKFYIGSTIRDLSTRFYEHHLALERGEHHSIYLQRAWNRYGRENFVFICLRKGPSIRIRQIEQFLLDKWRSYDPAVGYNMNYKVDSRLGRKMDAEARRKMSLAKKGRPSPNLGRRASDETLRKLSESHKGQISSMKGKYLSEEVKRKISKSCKGRKAWNKGQTCPQLSQENNGFYGKEHSEETKAKMSEAARNRPSNRKGQKCSEITKQKMSLGQKRRRERERNNASAFG